MDDSIFKDRIQRCTLRMKEAGIDVLLLTKPSNMYYLTGDGRLCAFAMVTADGKIGLGVPQTDVEDVKRLARFDHGLPTARKLAKGDLVMIDLAPIVNGYSSDMCRTVAVGKPSAEHQAAYNLYLTAQQAVIAKVKAGADMMDLEKTMHGIFEQAGHKDHIFGPPIHGVGIEFEEAPLPAGHAFFHGEKAPAPLGANTVIAVGNCGLYTGPWGVRVEDTVVAGEDGPEVLTNFPRSLRGE
jgi:Xaa-Pro aminopeptidase